MVRYLVSQGADVTAQDNNSILKASTGGHLETVKYLISQGADITSSYKDALRRTNARGNFEMVKYLSLKEEERKAQALLSLKMLYIRDMVKKL